MGVFNFLNRNKGAKEESNFLSLIITPSKVSACIWRLVEGSVEILGLGSKPYRGRDNLIHDAAIAIDSAGQQAKSDVSQVVFALSYNWLEDGKLSKETASLFKELSKDLELKPEAFIPIAAAINHLLKIEEETTPQAVLAGIFGDFCEVSLIKSNKVVSSRFLKSEVSVERIVNLIKQLDGEDENLPSRLVIYGVGEDTEIFTKLKKFNWENIFIQHPKIDLIDEKSLTKASAYAQAADILGYEPTAKAIKPIVKDEVEASPEGPGEFEFVAGEDVLASRDKGRVLEDKDEGVQEKEEVQYAVDSALGESTPSRENREEQPQSHSKRKFGSHFLPSIPNIFNTKFLTRRLLILGLVILVLLVGGVIVWGQTQTKAEVVIKVNAKSIEDSYRVTVVKGAPGDFEKQQIAGQEISGVAAGSQKAVVTGVKKTGNPAKGELSVFNWTTSPKTFSQGTVVISKDGVKFELTSDVEIASRSASTPGQNKVNVSAQEIGSGGNLTGGVDFTFQQFDEILYSGRNDSGFSGGEEKEVTVVGKEDLDRLEKSLFESLVTGAKNALKEKNSNFKLHDEAVSAKIAKKEFDKKVDDEATLLNLNMEVSSFAIVYSEQELKDLLAEGVRGDIEQNVEAKSENIEILDSSVRSAQNSLTISGKFRANLIPKLNEDEIKDKIRGKGVKNTREIIKQLPDIADVNVNFSPNLPIVSVVPRDKSKITLKLEPL